MTTKDYTIVRNYRGFEIKYWVEGDSLYVRNGDVLLINEYGKNRPAGIKSAFAYACSVIDRHFQEKEELESIADSVLSAQIDLQP